MPSTSLPPSSTVHTNSFGSVPTSSVPTMNSILSSSSSSSESSPSSSCSSSSSFASPSTTNETAWDDDIEFEKAKVQLRRTYQQENRAIDVGELMDEADKLVAKRKHKFFNPEKTTTPRTSSDNLPLQTVNVTGGEHAPITINYNTTSNSTPPVNQSFTQPILHSLSQTIYKRVLHVWFCVPLLVC